MYCIICRAVIGRGHDIPLFYSGVGRGGGGDGGTLVYAVAQLSEGAVYIVIGVFIERKMTLTVFTLHGRASDGKIVGIGDQITNFVIQIFLKVWIRPHIFNGWNNVCH